MRIIVNDANDCGQWDEIILGCFLSCPLASMNSSFPGKRHSNGRSKIILKTSAMTKYPYMGQPETNSRIVPSVNIPRGAIQL